ncbi:MAG: hypothetical protein Tsb0034_15560 [Ekhidna sp.]
MYNWMALMKVFTAGISFVTFLTLTYEPKHLIELRGPKKLQELIDKQTHELKDINKKLEEEIAQNELLFKEMHHRIKNNLQMVASLVRLKASMGMAPAEIAARVEKRIRSMSRVHDLLLHNKSIETITLHVYIKELVDSVYHSFHNNNVSIHEQVSDDIEIDTETAITLGLLLSEAITNAFKYAFPENESGEITIRAREIEIIIADDGKGYEKASEKKSGGMGQIIMENLVSNLRGKMDVKSGTKGTTIAITFRP